MLGTVKPMADEQQPAAAQPVPPVPETGPPVPEPVPVATSPGPSPVSSPVSSPVPSPVSSPVPSPVVPNLDTGYTAGGVPTLEGVREKIETRYGTALGATELAEETPEGRTAAEQYEAQRKAAAEKLEEIRASMRKPD